VLGPTAGIGAVEPFGATGPESSAGARKLMRTVSFFSGTVEVLTDGFFGSWSLIETNLKTSKPYLGQLGGLMSTA
jgi:hypothetical protein